MNFQDLHEHLRLELLRRVESGALTGTQLARQAGFRQAHISNFLNRKRSLSLEGLDRVMAAQGLTVDQILPVALAANNEAADVADGHSTLSVSDEITMVPLVSASTAAEAGQIQPKDVIETLPVAASRLSSNRVRPGRGGLGWQRFVALRLDAQQAAAMEPTLASGTIAVIDRHYNSLAPYRSHGPTLYAVRYATGLLLRYVEFGDDRLVLRPTAIDCAVQLIAIGPDQAPSDHIVGRVCLLIHEL